MALTAKQSVGEIARTVPEAVRVFQRHDIDFCCGGKLPLEEVCARHGLAADQVLQEIAAEHRDDSGDPDWGTAPLPDLIAHLLKRFHEPLRPELHRLAAMAQKVVAVHGSKDPERLYALANLVAAMRDELDVHMQKEERVLFPAVLAGAGPAVAMPIRVMEHDHDTTGGQLEELRRLTNNFQVPPGACNTWTALWLGLAQLDRDLRQHIHLENNVLFPRTLGVSA